MVDRKSRDKLAAVLQGIVDNPGVDSDDPNSDWWESEDVAVHGIWSTLDVVVLLMQERDMPVWQKCLCEIPKYLRFGINRNGLDDEYNRRIIERSIMFLRTDKPYGWKYKNGLPWSFIIHILPIFMLAAVVSVFVLKDNLSTVGIIILIMTILGIIDRAIDRCKNKDRRYWPFKNGKDYESAIGTGE